MWFSMNSVDPNIDPFERLERAVDKIRARVERVVRALEESGIAYAIIGGNSVAAWVGAVDEAAVRITRDVDILIERDKLEAIKDSLAKAGFVYRHVAGIDLFLEGPNTSARDAVHVVFAGEKVRDEYSEPAPSIVEAVQSPRGFKTLSLPALIRMKLTSFRDKDRMHVRDLIDVGLVGRQHCAVLPPALAERLTWILDHPED